MFRLGHGKETSLQLASRQIGAITVLVAEGDLTVPTAQDFFRRARLILGPLDPPLAAIDVSGIRRIDSSGFAALVALARHAERRGGQVCLVGLGADARLLLELMQLHLLFDVCEDVPTAIEMLSVGRGALDAGRGRGRRRLGRVRLDPSPVERRAAS